MRVPIPGGNARHRHRLTVLPYVSRRYIVASWEGDVERPRRQLSAATLMLWWVALTVAFAVVGLAVMFHA